MALQMQRRVYIYMDKSQNVYLTNIMGVDGWLVKMDSVICYEGHGDGFSHELWP